MRLHIDICPCRKEIFYFFKKKLFSLKLFVFSFPFRPAFFQKMLDKVGYETKFILNLNLFASI